MRSVMALVLAGGGSERLSVLTAERAVSDSHSAKAVVKPRRQSWLMTIIRKRSVACW